MTRPWVSALDVGVTPGNPGEPKNFAQVTCILLTCFAIGFISMVFLSDKVLANSTLYVAASGDDANDCLSSSTPCKNINTAIQKSGTGGIIRIEAGVYFESVLVNKALTIIGANSLTTIIDGRNTQRVLKNTAPVTITNITLQNGEAGQDVGGGILSLTDLTLRNTIIRNNTAYRGGGIYHMKPYILTLTNVSVISNTASVEGGGILLAGGSVRAIVLNTTVSGNIAQTQGGGILSEGFLSLMSTTIVGNSAGTGGGIAAKPDTTSLQASLLTANQGGNCYALFPGPFLSAGYNFDSDGRCALRTVGDSSGLDPKIGTLANNGGDTFTHALLSTSPAIDKVPSTLCVTDDQRGILRVAQGSQTENTPCDIGAYERNDMLLLPTQTSTVVPTQTPTFVPTQTPTITPTQTTTVVPTFAVSPTATSAIVSTATPLNTCSNRCTLFLPVTHK